MHIKRGLLLGVCLTALFACRTTRAPTPLVNHAPRPTHHCQQLDDFYPNARHQKHWRIYLRSIHPNKRQPHYHWYDDEDLNLLGTTIRQKGLMLFAVGFDQCKPIDQLGPSIHYIEHSNPTGEQLWLEWLDDAGKYWLTVYELKRQKVVMESMIHDAFPSSAIWRKWSSSGVRQYHWPAGTNLSTTVTCSIQRGCE